MLNTTTRFRCPILRCDWHYDRPPPPMMHRSAVSGPSTVAATSAFLQDQETEQAIEDHLNEHTLVDFAHTISEERQKAVAWLMQIDHALTSDETTWLDVNTAKDNVAEALAWFRAATFGAAESNR